MVSGNTPQRAAGRDRPSGAGAAAPPQGLSWSWKLDFDELLAALGPAASADAHADYEEAPAAAEGPAIPAEALAGNIAEHLSAGPALAGWLALAPPDQLDDRALAGVLASWRRLASWAQAGELAVAAQIASRAAARDDKIAVAADGRPAQVPGDAASEVALALAMSQYGASWWTDLGVTLAWRLAVTGEALRAGDIDLYRARLIAEATAVLDEETARAVEAQILPDAGFQTTGQLRAALRRAVIAADPAGADRRREEAERRAKVSLYPDEEGTATLAGQNLPGIRAAAAMARISALARAMKASGAGGSIDLLRAQVFVGLLLGTLPFIPPAEGAPPDNPPSDDAPCDDAPRDDAPRDDAPRADGPRADGPCPRGPRGGAPPDGPPGGGSPPGNGSRPGDDSPPAEGPPVGDGQPAGPPSRDDARADDGRGGYDSSPGGNGRPMDDSRPSEDHPPAGGGPPDEDDPLGEDRLAGGDGQSCGDDWPAGRPPPAWPSLPAFVRPAPAAFGGFRPVADEMLDLTVSWPTLAGASPEPGRLGRLGPITPAESRHLAGLASADARTEWRVILTSPRGLALAVCRIPRRAGPSSRDVPARQRDVPARQDDPDRQRDGPGSGVGLVSRVTVIVPGDSLGGASSAISASGGQLGAQPRGVILTAVLRAVQRAAARAAAMAAADSMAGECGHAAASAGYKPSPRLREFVVARDQTCRFLSCRQPAWRGDLDHTIPHEAGGLTCSCNLGGVCRTHHQLKQHPGWSLVQTIPGTFRWTTPTGRTYTIGPDLHPA